MRVLFINAVCGIGSTGRICVDAAKELEREGHEVRIAYGRGVVPENCKKYAVRIGGRLDVYWHALMTKYFDQRGLCSKHATRKFVEWANDYDPDMVWIHNIHDYTINYEILFQWIKSRPQMQVKWTQHDCWAFTGGCMYFSRINCYQWKNACLKCPIGSRKKSYHIEQKNFTRKRAAFTGVKNMTIIAVSRWIGQLVSESFLREYPVEISYNQIDGNVFKPTNSNFKEKYSLEEKKIILGVANIWDNRKGADDFIQLSRMIESNYVIVMVGLHKYNPKKLPSNIIWIDHTNDAKELAEIYTAADVFLNLTYEDNYPTVNLESQACGTPCITYRTGGSPESVPEENVVAQGDLKRVIERIYELCED